MRETETGSVQERLQQIQEGQLEQLCQLASELGALAGPMDEEDVVRQAMPHLHTVADAKRLAEAFGSSRGKNCVVRVFTSTDGNVASIVDAAELGECLEADGSGGDAARGALKKASMPLVLRLGQHPERVDLVMVRELARLLGSFGTTKITKQQSEALAAIGAAAARRLQDVRHASSFLSTMSNRNLYVSMVEAYAEQRARQDMFTVADAEHLVDSLQPQVRLGATSSKIMRAAAFDLVGRTLSLAEAISLAPKIKDVRTKNDVDVPTFPVADAFIQATQGCVDSVVKAVRVAKEFVSEEAKYRFLYAFVARCKLATPEAALCVTQQILDAEAGRELKELIRTTCAEAGLDFNPDEFDFAGIKPRSGLDEVMDGLIGGSGMLDLGLLARIADRGLR